MAVSKSFTSQQARRAHSHRTAQTRKNIMPVPQHKSARIGYRALRQIKMENLENGGRIKGGPVRTVLAWLVRLDKNLEVHDISQKQNLFGTTRNFNDASAGSPMASTLMQPLPLPAEAPIDLSLFTPDDWCHWDKDYCRQERIESEVVACQCAPPKKKIASSHERKHEKSMATSPLRKCFS